MERNYAISAAKRKGDNKKEKAPERGFHCYYVFLCYLA
jgi:hypothetical protein